MVSMAKGNRAMPTTYADYLELARICWRQSKIATTSEVSRTLRQMAQKYEQEAAKLNGRKVPNLEAE